MKPLAHRTKLHHITVVSVAGYSRNVDSCTVTVAWAGTWHVDRGTDKWPRLSRWKPEETALTFFLHYSDRQDLWKRSLETSSLICQKCNSEFRCTRIWLNRGFQKRTVACKFGIRKVCARNKLRSYSCTGSTWF